MEDKRVCPICGEPTKGKELCYACWSKKRDGKIVQCPDCGKWHDSETPCECTKGEEKKGSCIVCGEETLKESFLFCRDCYYEKEEFVETIVAKENGTTFSSTSWIVSLGTSMKRRSTRKPSATTALKLFPQWRIYRIRRKGSSLKVSWRE